MRLIAVSLYENCQHQMMKMCTSAHLVRMKQGHQHVFQDTAEQLPLCNRPTTKHNSNLYSESDFENYFFGPKQQLTMDLKRANCMKKMDSLFFWHKKYLAFELRLISG